MSVERTVDVGLWIMILAAFAGGVAAGVGAMSVYPEYGLPGAVLVVVLGVLGGLAGIGTAAALARTFGLFGMSWRRSSS